MAKFYVTTGGRDCGLCGGTGRIEARASESGAVTCPMCDGAGVLDQRLVPLAAALADLGILDRLAAVESAARHLEKSAK